MIGRQNNGLVIPLELDYSTVLKETEQRTLQKVKSLPQKLKVSEDEDLKKSSSSANLSLNFNKVLINRIRGVSRGHQKEVDIKRYIGIQLNSTSKLQKSKQNSLSIKEKFNNKTQICENQTTDIKQQKHKNITELQQTIQQLQENNHQLLKKLEKHECQIFMYKQQIEQLLYQVQDKENALEEMENYIKGKDQENMKEFERLKLENDNLQMKYQQLCEDIENKNQIIEEIQRKYSNQNFKIVCTVQEHYQQAGNFDKMALEKANSDIAALKKYITSLEKRNEQSYLELKRRKDEEIEDMRKKFGKNLNHYKEIIIKMTTKNCDLKKGRQQLHDTTITENSSNDQI